MKTSAKQSIYLKQFSTHSYGCSGECHCGVIHYDMCNAWDEDHQVNTLPAAQRHAKESPDRYQFQSNAIEYLDFNGRLYVIGCKCGTDKFIFDFLNEEKDNILSYFLQTKDAVSVEEVM